MMNVKSQAINHHEQKPDLPASGFSTSVTLVDQGNLHVPVHPVHNSKQWRIDADQLRKESRLQHEPTKNGPSFWRHWWLEILSYGVGLIAFGAIILTLTLHQGKPLPKWPSYITINSLISIFTAIMKASLILPVAEGISELKWVWFAKSRTLYDMHRFDSASRGPLGSLVFLCRIPWSILPALGAFITILALATDPFTQQIIHYYSCVQPSDHVATISRSNSYERVNENGMLLAVESVDYTMLATIYNSLLNPSRNTTEGVSFTCKSGNCDFPSSTNGTAYRSLAMCSSVSDLSHLITGNGDQRRYHYSLPSGLEIVGGTGSGFFGRTRVLRSSVTPFMDTGIDRPAFSYDTIMLRTDCEGWVAPGTTPNCSFEPWAFRSQLYPCVHTYGRARVSDFVLQEDIQSTIRIPYTRRSEWPRSFGTYSLVGDFPPWPGIDCSPTASPQGNKTQATRTYWDGQRAVVPGHVKVDAPFKHILYYDPLCTYVLRGSFIAAIHATLKRFFGQDRNPQGIRAFWRDPMLGYAGEAPWLTRLYANGNATLDSAKAFIQGLAEDITAHMRRKGDATNSPPVEGTVLVGETCIRVDWIWLTVDGVLLLLVLIFFTGAIWQSSKKTRSQTESTYRGPWKSSVLPLIWSGLEDKIKEQQGVPDEVKGMEVQSKKLKVQLKRFEGSDSESHLVETPLDGGHASSIETSIYASVDSRGCVKMSGSEEESIESPTNQFPGSLDLQLANENHRYGEGRNGPKMEVWMRR